MKNSVQIRLSIEPAHVGDQACRWRLNIQIKTGAAGSLDPVDACEIDALTPEDLIRFIPPQAGVSLNSTAHLVRYLSGHWKDAKGTPQIPEKRVLVEFGNKLFEHSFQKHPLWTQVRNAYAQHGQALQFLLEWHQQLGVEEIREVPWELLYDDHFIFQAAPSVHLIPRSAADRPEGPRRPHTEKRALLLTVADTDSMSALSRARLNDFQQAMALPLRHRGYTLVPIQDRTKAQLQQALKESRYDLVIVVCHGESDAAEAGQLKLAAGTALSGQELADAILQGSQRQPTELVVLASCWSGTSEHGPLSGMAQHLVRQRAADCALAFTTEISIPFALELTRLLCARLGRGHSKVQAFHLARQQLKHRLEWWTARLFWGSDRPLPDELSPPPLCPMPTRPLIGRSPELAGLVDWLRRPEDPNLAVIKGPSGSGKTALAIHALDRWLVTQPAEPGYESMMIIWFDTEWEARLAAKSKGEGRPAECSLLLNKLLSELTFPAKRAVGQRTQTELEAELAKWTTENTDKAIVVVVVLDGWPAATPLPAVLSCRAWKVLITTTGPTVRVSNSRTPELPIDIGSDILELSLSPLCGQEALQLLQWHPSQQDPGVPDRGLWPLHLLLLRAAALPPGGLQALLSSFGQTAAPSALHARLTERLVSQVVRKLSRAQRQRLETCLDDDDIEQPNHDSLAAQDALTQLSERGLIVWDGLRYSVHSAIRRCLPSALATLPAGSDRESATDVPTAAGSTP